MDVFPAGGTTYHVLAKKINSRVFKLPISIAKTHRVVRWMGAVKRTQGVVVKGMESSKRAVASGDPRDQFCLMGPVLFNDLDEDTECRVSKFAHDAKLGGVDATQEGCSAIQSDLDRLEGWAG